MRKRNLFTQSPDLRKLLEKFPISSGKLYHYTTEDSALKIISSREFKLTRADQLVDNREIKYGIGILKDQAKSCLSSEENNYFLPFLENMQHKLGQCYLLCLTSNPESQKHQEIHGNKIIVLDEELPSDIHLSSHYQTPSEDGYGYRLHWSQHYYQRVEGKVLYDYYSQTKISREICILFKDFIRGEHKKDSHHFEKLIMAFIILIKEEAYEWEDEYRVALIKNEKWKPFLETINANNKHCIKLFCNTPIDVL